MKNKIALFFFTFIIILSCLFTVIYASSNNSSAVLADEEEWEVIKQVNKVRAGNGLIPLSVTSEMMDAAERRAEELVELYSTDRPNGKYAYTILDELKISYSTFGQCMAEDVTEIEYLMSLWLGTVSYEREIMDVKYTHVGVGSEEEVGIWTMLMSGTCPSYNMNVVSGINAGIYPLGTEVEDFGEYIILNCSEHGRSYVPLISEMVSGYDSTVIGTQTLTAKYGEFQVNFNVTITDEGPPPSSSPTSSPTSEPSLSPTSEPSPSTSAPIKYTDVENGSWYEEAVGYVTGAGLFTGTGPNTFSPGTNLTRGMFVTVLGRLSEKLGEDTSGYYCTFSDLESGSWYYKYVCWAADRGIVTGYDSSTFGPNDNITREQMAVIFTRYAGSISVKLVAGEANFTDNSEISSWARYSVGVANASGLIQGYPDGSFQPEDYATRAQAAIIFQRFMVNYL